ncbi:MAG: hypothetical protein EZS28_021482 [Streblomastix strix]|uniref:Uncharacterized protein n=1 Tax=Streblomastix strix TaxID=222440 RepID=A0A5J4VK85_9EUKA|nr:MAG: hypothetical protein EZS28_021482 [Streblomastix strix]
MKELGMKIFAEHVTQNDLEYICNRSDGQTLTWFTYYIRLKQMIKIANFDGICNLPFKLQFIACGSDQFVKHFDVSERKQLREEQQSDKELFDKAADSTEMKFALVGAYKLDRIYRFKFRIYLLQ